MHILKKIKCSLVVLVFVVVLSILVQNEMSLPNAFNLFAEDSGRFAIAEVYAEGEKNIGLKEVEIAGRPLNKNVVIAGIMLIALGAHTIYKKQKK